VDRSSAGAAFTGGPRFVWPHWTAVAALVLLALVVRAGAVVFDTDYTPQNDSGDYDRHARSIAADFAYPPPIPTVAPSGGPSAFRAPGYPLVLGGVYALTGDSVEAGRYLNAVLGAVGVLLLYLVAARIFSRRVGLVAAGLMAVYPPLAFQSLELYSEPLFICLMLGAVLAALSFRDDPRLRWAILCGVLVGLAALTRQNGVLLIPILALALWLPPRRRGASLAAPAIAVLTAVLLIAPWTVRNYVVFNEFVPLTTGGGFNLGGVYNEEAQNDPRFNALWRLPIRTAENQDLYAIPGLREVELDSELRDRALDYLSEHPAYVSEVVFWQALRTLNLAEAGTATSVGIFESRGIGTEITPVEPPAFFLVALLAIGGAIVLIRRPRGERGPWWLWATMLILPAATLPIIGLPRYRAAGEPFLLILAAVGALAIWDWARGRGAAEAGRVSTVA
jgi:4-amino-4-deoxy-L-arabinose transferase-like glycosyltransferase